MTTDNSCSEPQWRHRQLGEFDDGPYEKTAANQDKLEIDHLKHEILKLKVHLQAEQLAELERKHFRESHPAVQDAWEQYQTVERLARKK